MNNLSINGPLSFHHQRGAIIIVTVVLMIVMITLVTLYTAKIQSFQHRIILNGQNQIYAYAAAESGIEQSIAHLASQKVWPESNLSGVLPSLHRFSVTATEQVIQRGSTEFKLFQITSRGQSADGVVTTSIGQQLILYPLLVHLPKAPLYSAGGLAPNVDLELVANPNGGGAGVPVSIWSDVSIDMQLIEGVTCGQQEWYESHCYSQPYSQQGHSGIDIVDNSQNFPADVIAHLFNVPLHYSSSLRIQADELASNCVNLSESLARFFWIDGDCQVVKGQNLGSVDQPIILVVNNGHLELAADTVVNGLIVFLKQANSAINYHLIFGADALVRGAFVSNQMLELNSGIFRVVYHSEILNKLAKSPYLSRVAKVPGSWQDHLYD